MATGHHQGIQSDAGAEASQRRSREDRGQRRAPASAVPGRAAGVAATMSDPASNSGISGKCVLPSPLDTVGRKGQKSKRRKAGPGTGRPGEFCSHHVKRSPHLAVD